MLMYLTYVFADSSLTIQRATTGYNMNLPISNLLLNLPSDLLGVMLIKDR
jgi:hypothetical protein